MPNSPAVDIGNRLIQHGYLSTLDDALPFGAVGYEPDVEDRIVVTVYDNGGLESNPAWERDYPRCLIRVKAADRMGYSEAYSTLQGIKDFLLGSDPFYVENTRYCGIWEQFNISPLAPDANQRPILIYSIRMVREYPSGGNRLPIE